MNDREMLEACRRRIAELERAIIAYFDGGSAIALRDALVTSFRDAVIASEDMTDEQRAYWLGVTEGEGRENVIAVEIERGTDDGEATRIDQA